MKIFTIGVFGSTEDSFFDALREAQIDTFCDIRWRRGVRGAEYIYANSARLQQRLTEMGIRYLHFRELAPPPAVRERQAEMDEAQGISRRKRVALSDAFVRGYQKHVLANFNSRAFVERMGPSARHVALFCVEGEPAACHRSLLAERLRKDLSLKVVHLQPHGSSA